MRVWQLSKPSEISHRIFLQQSPYELTAIADNPLAEVTVLGDRNGNFYLLNKKGEILQNILGNNQSEIKGIFWSSDFQSLWTITGTGLIEKWSYQNQNLTRIQQLEYPQQIADVKFDVKTGNLLLLEETESKLVYFNLHQQKTTSLKGIQILTFPQEIRNKQIKKIAIQPNSLLIALIDQNNNLHIWNRQTQESYSLVIKIIKRMAHSNSGKLMSMKGLNY